ncbi:MAG: N-acetyl-gamma-glutamyl-phosphate reductase [Pseudomonadota bacterium]
MTGPRELTAADIEALAVGAWILGTGGGGSPYLGLLNMRRLYAEGHRVSLLPPEELENDDLVAIVSNMGAPLVGQERLTDSRTIARAVALMEEHLGKRFRAIMALEIGGGNAIQPLMAAAHLGRPVVDADTMGRAYPEAQMTSVAVGDLRPYPLTTVDCRGVESIVEKVPTWKWMERVSRKICTEYGPIASTCKAPRSGAEVKRWGIPRTTSKAIRIGHAVREARLVANPGCYPTAAQLPLAPLLAAQAIEPDGIVIDAKSGVTGAGRSLREDLLFTEVSDGFHAYGVGRHRHLPEIEQGLTEAAAETVHVRFTPHLLPLNRGILATSYVRLGVGVTVRDLEQILIEAYAGEPFVAVRTDGRPPSTREVRGTNRCLISVHADRLDGHAILISVIDNLVKGAAGQAVQNLNLMLGLDETAGLTQSALFP